MKHKKILIAVSLLIMIALGAFIGWALWMAHSVQDGAVVSTDRPVKLYPGKPVKIDGADLNMTLKIGHFTRFGDNNAKEERIVWTSGDRTMKVFEGCGEDYVELGNYYYYAVWRESDHASYAIYDIMKTKNASDGGFSTGLCDM